MRRLVVTALCLWGLAGAVYGTRLLTFGERPAAVNVRWGPAIDAATRLAEERRYGLERPEFREGRTWAYALTDLSRSNVSALVNDPAVEDTHNINRVKFRPGLFTPRFPYDTPVPWLPVGLNVLSALLCLSGVLALGLAVFDRVAPGVLQAPRHALTAVFLDPRPLCRRLWVALTAWVGERIPEVSAEAAGLFRIVFGSALLIFLLGRPVSATWAAAPDNLITGLQPFALDLFVRAPWLAEWVRPWIVFWSACVIAGILTRTSFAMLSAGALAWAVLYTTRVTHHTVAALLLTLLFLQGARWGDAWSVDAWRRRLTPRRRTPREYGSIVWTPSLVLGVVFAAAAVAKLRESGIAWILNGTVKYHFLSDSQQALVNWGLYVGRYQWLAVLLSLAAIAIELSVIVGVFAGHYRYRLAAGVAAMSLLIGFALMQGLVWPGWWILLLSFLPWHLVQPGTGPAAAEWRRSARAPVMAVVGLCALQIVVSALKLEVTPLLSTYDMYSTTYSNEAEYASKEGLSYWLIGEQADGTTRECHVSRLAADAVSRAIAEPSQWRNASAVLDKCFDSSAAVARVSVQGRRSAIDWDKWPPAEIITVRMAGPSPVEN